MGIVDRIFSSHRDNLEITKPIEAEEDCISCRVLGLLHTSRHALGYLLTNITGSTAFVSMGGYVYFSGMQQLRQRSKLIEASTSKYKLASRQAGIVSLSATLVGLGIYRMLN